MLSYYIVFYSIPPLHRPLLFLTGPLPLRLLPLFTISSHFLQAPQLHFHFFSSWWGADLEFTSTGWAPCRSFPLNVTACEIPAVSVHSDWTVQSTIHYAKNGPIFRRVYGQRWKTLKIVREETLDVRCRTPRGSSSCSMLNTVLTVIAGRAQIPAAAWLFTHSLWEKQESQTVFFFRTH